MRIRLELFYLPAKSRGGELISQRQKLGVCFEIGSHRVAIAGLELSVKNNVALNSKKSPYYCLPKAGMKDVGFLFVCFIVVCFCFYVKVSICRPGCPRTL